VVFAAGCLAACSRTKAREQQAKPTTFEPPEQFLVDKETDLAAIVKVKRVDYRWVILPDGDHVPLVVAECEMEEALSGVQPWQVGGTQAVVQWDYSDLIFNSIAPPAILGRRYILWALVTPEEGEVPHVAPWTAHPQGFLLVRRRGDQEFIFWSGKSYSVAAIRVALKAGRRLPLDQIVDPVRRLRVAEERMNRREVGDEKAFIQGLLVNVLDADGQARKVEQGPKSGLSTDMFGMVHGEAQPHALWYMSLALLRDFGKDERRRNRVVEALTPVSRTARPRVRLAAALALVDLGSDAGREALISGFESESGPVSSDPPDQMTFPGRYPFDESSITACAHALARLGDHRGLKHPKQDVRLAAAEALEDKPDAELRKTLAELAQELEPQVASLKARGELAKPRSPGDHTARYPEDWVRTQRLLARFGDDQNLRRLVEAYLVDAATYPNEEAPLVPRGRPTSWSRGPSPARAIRGADGSAGHLLERLRQLYGEDERWDSSSFKALRASLQERPADEQKAPLRNGPTEPEITRMLSDSDPNRRAEALAAAGYHQVGAFFDRVLDVAIHGQGIERSAAIYALGFYDRDVPEASLRQLMTSPDEQVCLSAFELATRRDPARFARESMDVVRASLRRLKDNPSAGGEQARNAAYLPRILARLARGPLPAVLVEGLKDPDPNVRRTVVLALQLAGNPDAIPHLEALAQDGGPASHDEVEAALRSLGPASE
jgi:HEAT repeat protein